MVFRKIIPVLFVALLAAAPGPVRAQEDDPKAMFEEATRMMLQALELMIKAIPQYEPPVVLENGDILIRRKPKAGNDDDKPHTYPTETDSDHDST